MLKAISAKTASALSQNPLWIIVGLVVSVLVVALSLSAIRENDRIGVLVDGHMYKMELADTPQRRQLGLSGRTGLGNNEGMLFRFEDEGIYCFWMKDMKFDIDIAWVDYSERMVHFEENVSPSTYPKSFCNERPVQYVLEFKAGTIKRLQLDDKDKILLPCLRREGCYN